MKTSDGNRGRMTRRQLGGALLATAAVAQTPPSAPPTDELQSAREQNQHSAEALAKVDVAMTVEPAFHFTV